MAYEMTSRSASSNDFSSASTPVSISSLLIMSGGAIMRLLIHVET